MGVCCGWRSRAGQLWGSGSVSLRVHERVTHTWAREERSGSSAGRGLRAAPSWCQHLVTSAVARPRHSVIERQCSGHDLWGSDPWEITTPIISPLMH